MKRAITTKAVLVPLLTVTLASIAGWVGLSQETEDSDDVTAQHGLHALHDELVRGNYNGVLDLISTVEDIDAIDERSGLTILGRAAKDKTADAIDIVKPLIIQYGADTTVVDDHGYTALHYAAYSGNMAVAEILANHGAEIDAVNEKVKDRVPATPLLIAYRYGNSRIAEFLRFRGAEDFDEDLISSTKFVGALSQARREMRNKHRHVFLDKTLDPQEYYRLTNELTGDVSVRVTVDQGRIELTDPLRMYHEAKHRIILETPAAEGMSRREYLELIQPKMKQWIADLDYTQFPDTGIPATIAPPQPVLAPVKEAAKQEYLRNAARIQP